jgi:AmmeMemoRadiSam system protein B
MSMMKMIRKPIVAGQFYDADKENLQQSIKRCFLDKRGPGDLPKITDGNKNIRGVVVPHAGYIYSGAIAAHSYYHIANNGFADTFIILGPNHTGMGSGVSLMAEGSWETPLGSVEINTDLATDIGKGIIDKDDTAHINEHSIEVQLPFLQFISQMKSFDFVPICIAMQDINTAKEIGEILSEAIKKSDKKIVIIASSDFSHVGFNYMSMPPSGTRVDEYMEKQDKYAINKILEMDSEGLIETVYNNNISMCGYGPVSAMLAASKKLGAKKVELLKYGSSYEVHPGNSCVGYGAMMTY